MVKILLVILLYQVQAGGMIFVPCFGVSGSVRKAVGFCSGWKGWISLRLSFYMVAESFAGYCGGWNFFLEKLLGVFYVGVSWHNLDKAVYKSC